MKYAGRLLAWVFLTIGLAAAAMSHRSVTYYDAVQWKGPTQGFKAVSGNGQFSLILAPVREGNSRQGWSVGGGYGEGPRTRFGHGEPLNGTPWQSAIGQTFGVEAQVSPPMRDFDSGQWIRIRWGTVAVLFMIQPVVYVLRRLIARRRAAAEDAE